MPIPLSESAAPFYDRSDAASIWLFHLENGVPSGTQILYQMVKYELPSRAYSQACPGQKSVYNIYSIGKVQCCYYYTRDSCFRKNFGLYSTETVQVSKFY